VKQVSSRRQITVALAALIVLVLGGWLVKDLTAGSAPAPETKALSTLPSEVARTWRLIEAGGPFPYPNNDAAVFENQQNLLPAKRAGYYHEYTVPTPGSADRGPRRLVTGAAKELYYTGDHYKSFVAVDPMK